MATKIQVLVNGKVAQEVMADVRGGAIWPLNAKAPMINGFLLEQAGISREAYATALRSGKLTAAMMGCALQLGENPGGRLVLDCSAPAEEMTAAARERKEIDRLYAEANKWMDRGDGVDYWRLRSEADQLFSLWKESFPAEWASEEAAIQQLHDSARRERQLSDTELSRFALEN